jgi:hypothetical protein
VESRRYREVTYPNGRDRPIVRPFTFNNKGASGFLAFAANTGEGKLNRLLVTDAGSDLVHVVLVPDGAMEGSLTAVKGIDCVRPRGVATSPVHVAVSCWASGDDGVVNLYDAVTFVKLRGVVGLQKPLGLRIPRGMVGATSVVVVADSARKCLFSCPIAPDHHGLTGACTNLTPTFGEATDVEVYYNGYLVASPKTAWYKPKQPVEFMVPRGHGAIPPYHCQESFGSDVKCPAAVAVAGEGRILVRDDAGTLYLYTAPPGPGGAGHGGDAPAR